MGTCFNTKMLQPCDIIIEKKQSTFLDRLFGRAIAAVDKISIFMFDNLSVGMETFDVKTVSISEINLKASYLVLRYKHLTQKEKQIIVDTTFKEASLEKFFIHNKNSRDAQFIVHCFYAAGIKLFPDIINMNEITLDDLLDCRFLDKIKVNLTNTLN